MDTIFALATAQGKAGVSIVRISGPDAENALDALSSLAVPVGRPSVRSLVGKDGTHIDEAMVLRFAKPHSFTGEDVVELHVHGSIAVVQAVLRELSAIENLRHADAGEFTRRALENNRLDISKVEGLADLIDSETEAQRMQALRVLSGELGNLTNYWREKLVRAASLIEATIDFADEDVPVDVSDEVIDIIEEIRDSITKEINGSVIAERVRSGFEVAIVGAPNLGKSTLLNIIGGLLKADEGRIKIGSRNPLVYGTKAPNQVIDVRRKGVGWIFQDFHLLDHITSLENVILSLELAGTSSQDAERRAINAMERVELGDRMHFMPNELSGGQQQRVAVARAIAGSRPLLLADEPTGNLDVKAGESIISLFKELCADPDDPISVLMVTHDPILASKADRMLLMRDGKTAASDIRSAWGESTGDPI